MADATLSQKEPSPRVTPSLEDAIAKLRSLTVGQKGDRTDYVGLVSCADATVLIRFIDTARPLYDARAVTPEEIKFLRSIRGLSPDGVAELVKYEAYLAAQYSVSTPSHDEVPNA